MTDPLLQKKALYFDSIFTLAGAGIVIVDQNGIIRSANPAIAAMLGYSGDELTGQPFSNLSYLREAHKQFTAHNPLHRFTCASTAQMEMNLLDKNGSEVPVRFRPILLKDDQGTVTEAIGILENMTEPTRQGTSLAEKMWEAQQNFDNVLDYSADAIIICDINGNIMTANKALLQLLGYTQEEVRGKHIVEITAFIEGTYKTTTGDTMVVDEAYLNVTTQYSAQLFEKGYVNCEAHLVTKASVIVPVDTTMSVLKDKDGERRGSLVIARDITRRTLAEKDLAARTEDLQKTKDQLEQIIDASLDPIIIGDAGGYIIKANRAFLDLVGHTEAEVLGERMYTFSPRPGTYDSTTGQRVEINDAYFADVSAHIARMFDEGKLLNWRTYAVNKGNKVIPVTQNIVLLRNEAGEITLSLGIIRDITEQRKAELALIAAKESAEAANESKGAFLANMSHEIRTPMNGVIGFTDMLLDTPLDEEQRDFAQTIKRSGEALLSLINDILDFSKIEAGQIKIEKIDFDIEMLAYDACEMLRPRLGGREVELLCRIGDDVPAFVRGDPHRLRQVIVNLLGNAVKFTEEGEIELSLDVEQEQSERVLLHTKVRDTGIGIPRDKLESVFEMFQQADSSTTRKYGGTGLGLSICRKIAALMGGHCWAESEPGRGSTFHFTAWVGEPSKKQVQRFLPVALVGKRVVITDDNRTNLEILTHVLDAAGMSVSGFMDGKKTLQAIIAAHRSGRPFDICILDVRMPGMSGYDVAEQIRATLGDSLPLLAFTSSTEGGARKCSDSGFNGFLPKPIKRVKLYKMIERLLGESLGEKAASAGAAHAIVTQHSIQEDAKHSASILLAEDNPVNQKLAVKLLTKAGYTVEVAQNGREAVEKYEAGPDRYDIIFMDIQMPELNGLEATGAIRDRENRQCTAPEPRHIPIIAMTANAMTGDREKCLAAGMNDYIPKPIKREIVFELLRKWVFERVEMRT